MNNYSDKTDETLVEPTLLGCDEAYEELVVRHEKAVKGTAYKVTGNSFSAEYAYRSEIELVSKDETVDTPAGRFDNCVLLQYTRNVYASNVSKIHYINAVLTNRAYICHGIGIVKHMVDMDRYTGQAPLRNVLQGLPKRLRSSGS